jgi:hypothetical protein
MPKREGGAQRLVLPSMGPVSRHTQQIDALPVFLLQHQRITQHDIPTAQAPGPGTRQLFWPMFTKWLAASYH